MGGTVRRRVPLFNYLFLLSSRYLSECMTWCTRRRPSSLPDLLRRNLPDSNHRLSLEVSPTSSSNVPQQILCTTFLPRIGSLTNGYLSQRFQGLSLSSDRYSVSLSDLIPPFVKLGLGYGQKDSVRRRVKLRGELSVWCLEFLGLCLVSFVVPVTPDWKTLGTWQNP